ncbi:MAG: hypothetical protein Q8P95_03010 [bacterium]|nr:hypothetical protein [bacterium]
MRKKIFLSILIFLTVLLLIFAFENIQSSGQFLLLFFQIDTSATIIIFLSGFIGFLIGFFAMLYAYELRNEGQLETQQTSFEAPSASPSANQPQKKVEAEPAAPQQKEDPFEADDEVLG